MASGRIKGITIELGADASKFTKALAEIDKASKTTQSNLRDINKALKLDPGNVELLKDKQNELGSAVDQAKQKLEQEKKALEEMEKTEGFDANSQAAKDLKTQIDLDTVALQEAQNEMKNFGSVGQQQMKLVASKMKELGGKISQVGKSLTTAVTLPVLGAGTAAVKMASDYEENLNKVDVAFQDSSDSVKEWAKTATEQFGLSESAALEATSLFGDMGTSMGLTTKDAADMSTSLAGLAGDLSSFKNVDIETAMNALKGVFTGETESLKGLGVVMTETNLEEFAEKIGKSYKEMSQAEKVTLRYQYVLKNTQNAQGDYARTSDGTANSIRTLQASVNNLAVTFGQELIPVITPIINKITEIVKKFGELDEGTKKLILVIAGIAAAVGPVLMVVGKVISVVGSLLPIIAPLVAKIGGLKAVFAALSGPIGIVIGIIAALVAAFTYLFNTNEQFRESVLGLVEVLQNNFQAAMTALQPVLENLGGKLAELMQLIGEKLAIVLEKLAPVFEFILTAIVGLVSGIMAGLSPMIDFIAGVIETFTLLWEAFFALLHGDFDTFFASISAAWDAWQQAILSFINSFIQGAIAFFSAFGINIKAIITNVLNSIVAIVTNILTNIRNLWNNGLEAVKSIVSKVFTSIKNIFSNLKTTLSNIFTDIVKSMKNWGRDMIDNLIGGIKEKIGAVKEAVSNVAGTISEFLHFSEPDKGPLSNFSTYAPDMMKLFAQGIRDNAGLITSAITSSFDVKSLIGSQMMTNTKMQTAPSESNVAQPINVNLTLEGDANRIFRLVNAQANRNRQITGQLFN